MAEEDSSLSRENMAGPLWFMVEEDGSMRGEIMSGPLLLCVADSCQFGSYYNLTLGQCVLCPVGFYAELPGSYLCDACPVEETTAREGSTASVSCSVNPITTTSAAPFTTGAGELCVCLFLGGALPQAGAVWGFGGRRSLLCAPLTLLLCTCATSLWASLW